MTQMLKDRCIEARKAAGYRTVPPFAKAVGVEPATIYYIENGQTQSPDAETLAGYARVTGYSAEWLRTGRGQKMNTDVNVFTPGTGVAESQAVSEQRALIAAVVRLNDYVRDVALDPIPPEKQEAVLEEIVRVVQSVGAERIADGSALVDAARQVASAMRATK